MRKNSERGAAVVEFTLLALLLLIFVFGIIEFGFIWLQSNYIANAAREGARVGSKLGDPAGTDLPTVKAAVKNYLKGAVVYSDSFIDDEDCCNPKNVEIAVLPTSITGGVVTIDSLEVDVTVQTARIWEPVLWDLLSLMPGYEIGEIRQITETAIFPLTKND